MNKKVLAIFTIIILAFCLISCDKEKKLMIKGTKQMIIIITFLMKI